MNFKELHEGAEPKMPGAPSGIKIMTPQQFVADAGDSKSDDEEELKEFAPYDHNDSDDDFDDEGDDELRSLYDTKFELEAELDYADEEDREHLESELEDVHARILELKPDAILEQGVAEGAPELLKKEMPLHRHAEKLLAQNGVSKDDPDYHHHLGNTIKHLRQFGNIDLINKSDEQGVAEGSGGNWYIRVNGKILNDTKFNPMIFSSKDEARSHAMKLADKKRIPLSQMKLTKSWMDAPEQGVAEGSTQKYEMMLRNGQVKRFVAKDDADAKRIAAGHGAKSVIRMKGNVPGDKIGEQGVAEEASPMIKPPANRFDNKQEAFDYAKEHGGKVFKSTYIDPNTGIKNIIFVVKKEQGVAEGQEHLDRIRKLSGLGEATKLPASTRDLGGQEFQDYMNRIVGTPDVDKQGNVKVDKKGNEKYVSGKTKGDKYKMPYIHRSSVVTYMSPDGQTYDEDAVKKTLAIRPKSLLKQNEKMKHSNGEFEQFFNVGFAALVGIALDEQTNNLIVVNTCPGAGSCKVDCFAMKGGKIQFKAAWQSDGRILTYLLNDPDGFFNQLSSEISKEASAGAKGDKKFPDGWQTTVRWHDAGDFFSPEYLDMALKMAAKHPDVRFYAYTKMAGAALAQKPDNFIINWSEGANTEQEKQIKAQDPKLDTTKNSRIVPEKLFYDLLAKDEKGNLQKTDGGAWQPASPDALAEMKQRIAKQYGISVSSILSYDEYMAKRKSIPAGMKYNVIVAPGEGDISANDPAVLSTLLLRH